MKYKPNQKLVCTVNSNGNWIQETNLSWIQYIGLKSRITKGPKFNEIVTVDTYMDCGGISFKEYDTYKNGERNTFDEIYFEPLISDSVLQAELERCREPDFI